MIYKIMLGLVSVIFGHYAYTGAGLVDPAKTLFGVMFLGMAAAIFLDDTEDRNEVDEDD